MADLGYHSAQGLHYQIEAMRQAYVDRNSYLGDPDFVKKPVAHLLDKGYADKLWAAIEPQEAGISQNIKPGVASHEGNTTTMNQALPKKLRDGLGLASILDTINRLNRII
jgi:gamma-glutamyltranspeptidase/glutathione hydrolase